MTLHAIRHVNICDIDYVVAVLFQDAENGSQPVFAPVFPFYAGHSAVLFILVCRDIIFFNECFNIGIIIIAVLAYHIVHIIAYIQRYQLSAIKPVNAHANGNMCHRTAHKFICFVRFYTCDNFVVNQIYGTQRLKQYVIFAAQNGYGYSAPLETTVRHFHTKCYRLRLICREHVIDKRAVFLLVLRVYRKTLSYIFYPRNFIFRKR